MPDLTTGVFLSGYKLPCLVPEESASKLNKDSMWCPDFEDEGGATQRGMQLASGSREQPLADSQPGNRTSDLQL